MKTIEIDEELYRYIASHTHYIGESASEILRRLLKLYVGENAPPLPSARGRTGGVIDTDARDSERVIDELLQSDEYRRQNKAVNRFLLVLSVLYTLNAGTFSSATEALHGRTRRYFASDQQTLLLNGTHTKPKQVPNTPYWVITNTNTSRKCNMIEHIMRAMGFSQKLTVKVCGSLSFDKSFVLSDPHTFYNK